MFYFKYIILFACVGTLIYCSTGRRILFFNSSIEGRYNEV
jgi:hypothetical protein